MIQCTQNAKNIKQKSVLKAVREPGIVEHTLIQRQKDLCEFKTIVSPFLNQNNNNKKTVGKKNNNSVIKSLA